MDEGFKQYLTQARDNFVRAVNEQKWDSALRLEAENLLVAFDQMRDKLETSAQVTFIDYAPGVEPPPNSNEICLGAVKLPWSTCTLIEKLKGLKRYESDIDDYGDDGCSAHIYEYEDGRWVEWDDLEQIINDHEKRIEQK